MVAFFCIPPPQTPLLCIQDELCQYVNMQKKNLEISVSFVDMLHNMTVVFCSKAY